MTNFEKFKEELLALVKDGDKPAITKNGIGRCDDILCEDCLLDGDSCVTCTGRFIKWLYEEYKETPVDWSKVAVDTLILVSYDGKRWYKRHFARVNEHNEVYAWKYGTTSWSHPDDAFTEWKYAKLANAEADNDLK